ncbi:ABC transporter ATP-binding protein [Paenibacillus mesophilus]|uniref:ABC transporter ATP-binding protein n=1 Tax=Paenibacillus mesophilus TaxID=2582849 RepID=UPI00110E1052|nr:ABC transporter ATP-binding protein [Paenibacillus mesophilus]TMV52249.1 ABC transporter ATP-binding protein [Paenibacillus mesophilus]
MKQPVIQTAGLTKVYRGRAAVDALNLQIGEGEIYGFLGPNGAGKTTTIRMLLGLIKPTSGSIRILGQDMRSNKLQVLRQIGSLVEYPSYYGHLSAVDNLEAIRRILNVPRSRIAEVLNIVSLTKESRRPVRGFSLGMKQRLGIAAALLGSPKLLILDEPTNGLDPEGILEIRELIKDMPRQHGMTVLVSSHLLSEVEQMAGTVGIIREGRMVFQDTIQNLRLQSAQGLKLSVSDPEKALGFVRVVGGECTLREGMLYCPDIPDREIAYLVRGLVEQGHDIYRIEEQRKSLEDIFMRIVGKDVS